MYLPTASETIHAFGVGSGGVRWRHVPPPGAGVRPGSRAGWLVVLVEKDVTHLDLTAGLRFDLCPAPDWNVLPSLEPVDLRLEVPALPSPLSARKVHSAERPTRALPPAGPRVFISYTHDDDNHKQLVRDFANLLINCGIDVRLDQFEAPRRRDWYLWAIDNIDQAEFVIVIASPKCRAVGEGTIDRNDHPGMHCEFSIIRDRLQGDRKLWEQKLLPVVLPGEVVDNIPVFLQPRAMDRYCVDELTEDAVGALLATIHHGVKDDSRSPIALTTMGTGPSLTGS
ncbi:SEFIR domain-containing protein [Actinosynnema sp. NPDC091369]